MLQLLRSCVSKKKDHLICRDYFNVDYIPESIYDSIFCHVSGTDLKNCRLVCKKFEKMTSTFMDEKTCIIFEDTADLDTTLGRLHFYKRKSKKLLNYLAESELKFSLWSTLKLRQIDEIHIETLLSEKISQHSNSLQNITHIEFDKCRLTWSTLVKFLSLFKNLEKYSESSNKYFTQSDTLFDLCCQQYFDPEEKTLKEVFNHRIAAKKINFSFVEPNWDVLLMMRVLEITCSNLQEFTLAISSEKQAFPFERTEFSHTLGLFLLKSLATLKSLTICWTALNYHFFFEDFFRVIPVLMTSTKIMVLTELCLDFDWILIGHSSFEMDLIPFVRKLVNLKKFILMRVILQAGLGHLIEELRPPSKCDYQVGILLSDHPTLDEALMNRELLKTQVFTNCVCAIRIAMDLTDTQNVGQMIPIDQQSCMYLNDDGEFQSQVKYLKTSELMIKHIWNGPNSHFISYNIHGIVNTFPNLTELCIFDGPKFDYVGTFRIRHQCDYMSEALLLDSDLQLIFNKLTKLKALRVRACLEQVTDCGLTGLDNEKLNAYEAMVACPEFKPNRSDILPFSVSNLQDIEELVLKGIGDGVTDVSAYFAFNGLKKLQVLGLCGSTKITRAAKDYLRLALNSHKNARYEFT